MNVNQTLSPIHVVGIGLDGAEGLSQSARQIVDGAVLLVGSDRHLSYFPDHPAQRLIVKNFLDAIDAIRNRLAQGGQDAYPIVILASGDPLFFGLGRLLLAHLPTDWLTFHPHLSAVQLAFSRVKLPWQDAQLISAHGRSLDRLTQALKQGINTIAVLTDPHNTPAAIARLIMGLKLPFQYQFWVCEDLGGSTEQVCQLPLSLAAEQTYSALNIVVLHRDATAESQINLADLPQLGVPDEAFYSFSDRPGLLTKREVRVMALAELALSPGQHVWDVGAGTGSVSIEIARLCPTSRIWAIEKTTAGATLIQQNCQRFQVSNISLVHGTAPECLRSLPNPDRIFIGGSGGQLPQILDVGGNRLKPQGKIVIALATIEHLNEILDWCTTQRSTQTRWDYQFLQVQLARSLPVAHLTRWNPLNPVTIAILTATHKT